MKKFLPLALAMLLTLTFVSSAFAVDTHSSLPAISVSNNENYSSLSLTGEGVFLLSQSQNRIIGVKEPDEDVTTLKMQFAKPNECPGGIFSNGVIRIKAYTNVLLDENKHVSRGGVSLSCTLNVFYEDMLRETLNLSDEEIITVTKVVDATIFSPNIFAEKPIAAHMFMTSNLDRIHVADLVFSNGVTLPVYSADWDNDGELELGFAPYVSSKSSGGDGDNGNGGGGDNGGNGDGDDNPPPTNNAPNPQLRPRNPTSESSGQPNPQLRGR